MTAQSAGITGSARIPAAVRPVRWFHLLILILLLALGGAMRWSGIDKESLAFDEYWALYLATGRSIQVFKIPYGVIVDSPPNVGFAAAPPWWRIWTGLSTVSHPPLYYLSLRWWIDLFGPSDRAARAMASLFGLGAAGLLFDAVRRGAGPWRGLIAAGFLLLAPAQIDHSQMVRPYTMMEFIGVGLCDALIAIQQRGPTAARLTTLGAATAALALTHYFSAGAILAAGLYAAVQFHGRTRTLVLITMAAVLFVAAAAWAPVFWETRNLFATYQDFLREPDRGLLQLPRAIVQAPIRFLLAPSLEWQWFYALPLAVLVFVVPLFQLRKSPEMLLWWLWAVGTIGVVTAADLIRHSTMVGVIRYVLLASPAVYSILATAIPRRLGMLASSLILICAAVWGAARVQVGPEPGEDWKTMARLIDRAAGPHDVVALLGFYRGEPSFDYFVITHYVGDWKRPVIFLSAPPSPREIAQLAARPRVWMVGHHPDFDTGRMLPGWRIDSMRGVGKANAVWAVLPPPAGNSPP